MFVGPQRTLTEGRTLDSHNKGPGPPGRGLAGGRGRLPAPFSFPSPSFLHFSFFLSLSGYKSLHYAAECAATAAAKPQGPRKELRDEDNEDDVGMVKSE